jgi:hypothetical protein
METTGTFVRTERDMAVWDEVSVLQVWSGVK